MKTYLKAQTDSSKPVFITFISGIHAYCKYWSIS